MSKDQSNNRKGVSSLELLTLVFIVLKLLNVITWSWWWVLSPIWITLLLAVVIAVAVALFS